MAGWRAVCPENNKLTRCREGCRFDHPHRFEIKVDRYESVGGRLVADARCPHHGLRLRIAGGA